MSEKVTSEYTPRQIALLERREEPNSNKEWDWLQTHANVVLPQDRTFESGLETPVLTLRKVEKKPKPSGNIYGVDAKKMAQDFDKAGQPDREPRTSK